MTSPPDSETEIVADQIAAMDAEISRIDGQLARLQARKNAMGAMKKALSPLAGAKSEVQKPLTVIPCTANGTGQHPPLTNGATFTLTTSARKGNGKASPTSTGFRQAIRAVLRDYPRGLRPSEVRRELETRGELSQYTGRISPAIRIGNALYALKKTGKVTRRAGRYHLGVENITAIPD